MTINAHIKTHVQPAANMAWTIQHELESTMPAVECFLMIDGKWEKVIPLSVKYPSATEVQVLWSVPRSGRATLAG